MRTYSQRYRFETILIFEPFLHVGYGIQFLNHPALMRRTPIDAAA